jgi:predicted transcriptional regulator
MIETLISSKTRIKLLLKFFLNSRNKGYLRGLESEFGESSNAIRIELNKLEGAGLLNSYTQGNRKYFQANTKHPLYKDINNILLKYTGLDRIVESVVENLGDLQDVYVVGKLARGLRSEIIDLVLVGDIDKTYLLFLIERVEKTLKKKVKYITYSLSEFDEKLLLINHADYLLLWSR